MIKQHFIFTNCTETEADIITNFLAQENILFKTKERKRPIYYDENDDDPSDYISIYDIDCYTDLEHFDFIKVIANKKIEKLRVLDKIFYSKVGKRSKKVRERVENFLNANKNIHNKK